MAPLKFAIIGTGFWSRYQLAAWRELRGANCVAAYNRTRAKAEALAHEFNIPRVYDDPAEMLAREAIDFVDIITDVGTHPQFVELAALHGRAVICQKPMAGSLRQARAMTQRCHRAKVPFFIHENWRWQRPIRELHAVLKSGTIGRVFRARLDYGNSFPVFENQPFLKELEQFILTDIGTHILDSARFLFGEARSLRCHTQKVHRDIRGEDVATVLMRMKNDVVVTCNMSYASRVEHDRFPETFIQVEGEDGSIELGPDFWLRTTTRQGTRAFRVPPPFYPWADARYSLVHASIVDCHRNLLAALQGRAKAETTAEDNLRTLELVFGAYQSAARDRDVHFPKS